MRKNLLLGLGLFTLAGLTFLSMTGLKAGDIVFANLVSKEGVTLRARVQILNLTPTEAIVEVLDGPIAEQAKLTGFKAMMTIPRSQLGEKVS